MAKYWVPAIWGVGSSGSPCSSTRAVLWPSGAVWCDASARAIATVIRSCFSHERSRRSRRLRAAPAAMSTPAMWLTHKKGHARAETCAVVVILFLLLFFFLSFSFSLCRGSKSVFLGLNFVTISLNISFKKKFNCSAHLGGRGTPFGPSFPFFPPFFFLPFSFLFHFLFFLKKKKCFSLFSFLAFVSGFFFKKKSSRCSTEMWCLYDIGRDSWDWVGPPAWGRACFNSPEWGGGSSLVKTEPPQIVLLLLF